MLETNELTQKLRTLLHPRAALIAYSGEKDNSYASDNNYFVEIRDIDDNGMMGEGRPVTVDFRNELVRGYSESHSTTPYGRIPPNMLWCDPRKGSERYIWYNSPQKRMMFFKESLQVENAKYNLPGVIYVAGGSSLSIYAYKDKKLTEKTELYAAPFFNVTGANVCLGSAKAERFDLQKPVGVLGEEVLADGVFTPGRRGQPDQIKPDIGDKGRKGQAFQPRRTETFE